MDGTEYDKFLKQIALGVDKQVILPQNMTMFQQRISSFAKRWTRHINDCESAGTKRRKHWQDVKKNPAWQDKKAGPTKKDWEWDKFYLFDVGIDIGPTYEMPAKYAPAVMASLEGYIERNLQKIRQYSPTTMEYRSLEKKIVYQQQTLGDIRSQFDKLPNKNEGWISTAVPLNRPVQGPWVQFLWFRHTDLSDEEVFGCWRPQPKQIEPNPLELIIPQAASEKLPRPASLEQEYERYYVVLTSIHDNILPGVQSISDGIWPQKLAEEVWFRLTKGQPYGPDKSFIEVALERVNYDLYFKAVAALNDSRGKLGFHSKRNE